MDIDNFLDRIFESWHTVTTINTEHHAGRLTLKEKGNLLNGLREVIKKDLREALDQEIDSALSVINRYKSKYESVQKQNHSVAMTGNDPLVYGGEVKKNLDSSDKMILFLLKLISDDVEELKDART